MLDWFAVYVQSRHEKTVSLLFTYKGLETCLPLSRTLRKWSDRRTYVEEPIFPGYVFCRFDKNVRTPILRTPGVIRIVGSGMQAIPIEPDEMIGLKTLERAKAPVEQWPFINSGHWVHIESGPLEGLSGTVIESKKGLRVIVSVALLQRSVAIEVNRSQIRPTSAPFAGAVTSLARTPEPWRSPGVEAY